MSTCKVILNEQTLMDVTDTTAEAAEVLAGEYFYAADGTRTLGTGSGGVTTRTCHIRQTEAYYVDGNMQAQHVTSAGTQFDAAVDSIVVGNGAESGAVPSSSGVTSIAEWGTATKAAQVYVVVD